MIVIGIDPGITGALAMVGTAGLLRVDDMPTYEKPGTTKVRREICGDGLSELLSKYMWGYSLNEVVCVVEFVSSNPGQGVASVFSLGHSAGVIAGVLAAKGVPTEYVTPARWKASMGLGNDKARSIAVAKALFPNSEPWLKRKKDHNRAEAIMLAHFGATLYC